MLVARARLEVERGHDRSAEQLAEGALVKLRAVPAPPPLKEEALTVLGRALWEEGEFRSAMRALEAATALDPKAPRAFYYLGLVDEDLHRLDEARRAFETAVANDPVFADAYYYLGRRRAEAGDPGAPDAYRRYLELAPTGTYADDARRALTPTSAPARTRRRGR
jgi:tetratricopeptide (TPR) repeat protein